MHHRITPKNGTFRVEAVTASGAVDLVATYAVEEEAVQQLRLLQLANERMILKKLAADTVPL